VNVPLSSLTISAIDPGDEAAAVTFLCRRENSPPYPFPGAGRTCAAVLVLAALAGCTSDGPLASITPPNPDVPKVEADNFPSIGAQPTGRPPPLSAEDRAKLQADLEALAKDREAKLKRSIGADN
jgi:predicted small lipoprotein YifL